MKYVLFLGFFSLIILVSCNINKNEKKKITPDLLNCCFKTNSYWVYIDSVSNNIDSVYVVEYDHYYHEYYVTDYTSYDIEHHTFSTYSSSSLETTKFEVSESSLIKICYNPYYNSTILYNDYNNYSEPISNYEYIVEGLDSTFIYDRYYYRLYKVEVAKDETEDNNKSIYFTNSDYGILRHDIYSDSILLSSKILMRKNIVR